MVRHLSIRVFYTIHSYFFMSITVAYLIGVNASHPFRGTSNSHVTLNAFTTSMKTTSIPST